MTLSRKFIAIQEKRARSEPLPCVGVPTTSSYPFKTQDYSTLPMARQWDKKFSIEGQHKPPSTLKSSQKSRNFSQMISLGVARPSPEYYPWSSITFEGVGDLSRTDKTTLSTVSIPCNKGEKGFNLDIALNYGYAAGTPQILRFITEHVEMVHNPPYNDWECSLTCGTSSALEITFRIFCARGDWILVEDHLYAGTIDIAKGQGLNLMGLKMDEHGLLPDVLDSTLCTWDTSLGRKPSILYIIPSGQNPTGKTQPLERRKAIYEVAERHDLYIVEDDPYYFIQLKEQADGLASGDSVVPTIDQYLEALPRSYLSLDRSGRVLRMDSTSKIIAPRIRCGWITGCSQVIAKFLSLTENSTVAPSGPSQVMLYKLLEEAWGHEGFFNWLIYLSMKYSRRSNLLLKACRQHLPQDFCRWVTPSRGMFLWVELDMLKHPSVHAGAEASMTQKTYHDIEDRIYEKAQANGVQVSKGSWFAAEQNDERLSLYFRMTFAAAPENVLDKAVERFGTALKAEFMQAI